MLRICCLGVVCCIALSRASYIDINEDDNHIPIFRPLRRLISNFGSGRRAQLTLVFQCDVDFDARWFKSGAPDIHLPMAEIPEMLPIPADDPNYRISSIHSGTVHALTMNIVGLQESFPIKYVTIFSAKNRPMQYHLTSIIESPTERILETLDAIVWEDVPPKSLTFEAAQMLTLSCVADLDSYSGSFTDEMNLMSAEFKRKRKNRYGVIKSRPCGHVHTARGDYWEEFHNIWYSGTKLKLNNGAHRFNFTFKVRNASRENQGIFTCGTERESDKTFISSWVKQGRPGSKSLVEIIPCDGTKLDKQDTPYEVGLKRGQPACIRCRSFGYPDARMNFYKGSRILSSTANLHLDFHHNLADGGVPELTLTFWNPSERNSGAYSCQANNDLGLVVVDFNIQVA